MATSRDDLRALAIAKVHDAELLFQNRRYSNAYYLFGYGIELALKARISKVFLAETIPDKNFVLKLHTHDIDTLVGLAGLSPLLKEQRNKSPRFDSHWIAVYDWSEQARYDMVDEFRATAMRNAMLDKEDGVFQWLQNNW